MNQHETIPLPSLVEVELLDLGDAISLVVSGAERMRLGYDHELTRRMQRGAALREAHNVSRGLGMAGIACCISDRS